MKNEELVVEHKPYSISNKTYYLWDDFDFDELDWLNVVHNKLTGKDHEVSGSFTGNEILKTLSIILRNEDGSYCDINEFRKVRESLQVKIIADFFLSKAILGIITTSYLKLSEQEKKMQQTASMN